MYLTIFLIALLTLVTYIWMKRPKKLNLPGPPGIPMLGNLLQIDTKCSHEQFARWADKYGGAFKINLMGTNWVIVSSYEHLHQILLKDGSRFANRPVRFRAVERTFGLKNLSQQNNRTHFHTVAKRAVQRNLKLYNGGMEHINHVISTMLDGFINKMQQTDGNPHNPKIDIYNFTLQSVLHFGIGKFVEDGSKLFTMGRQVERIIISTSASVGPGIELDMFPWLRFFPNKTFKKIQLSKKILTTLWEMLKPELDADSQGCIMESIMHTQHEELQQTGILTIDDDNMKALLSDIIVAGTTTTSNSLTSFINILVHYPEIQVKLQEEVDVIVGPSRAVSAADRQSMPYTCATIYELNRYVSVVPLGIPHSATEDCELAGATIPKGTRFMANTWALHHNEKFWGDPWNFRPERFLDGGEVIPADHEFRKHLFPFGAGPRVCPGELFAMTRMFLFIATVMQHFTIRAATGKKVSCDPRSYIFGATLSAPDFEVSFVSRE